MGHSVSVHFRFPSTLQKMFSSKSCKGRENRVEMTPPFRNWSHILLLISKKPEALHVRLFSSSPLSCWLSFSSVTSEADLAPPPSSSWTTTTPSSASPLLVVVDVVQYQSFCFWSRERKLVGRQINIDFITTKNEMSFLTYWFWHSGNQYSHLFIIFVYWHFSPFRNTSKNGRSLWPHECNHWAIFYHF